MKKPINLAIAAAFALSLATFSCKDKPTEVSDDPADNVEAPVDNTGTPDPAAPPINDSVPGVESGAGDEQVP